ncbi:MAG TPA: metallophosphoesterase [Actinomycetota bacterium]|nr:metallophosphoesterase [Actinomycetota bacterium]
MPRILAIADEPTPGLPDLLDARPDVIVSCGDLPWDDLERMVDLVNVPLLFVPGNHDPELRTPAVPLWPSSIAIRDLDDPPGPRGCTNVDGRIEDAAGLRIAGLGGSIRYRSGPHQYTQQQMARRARKLARAARRKRRRDGKGVDVVIAHSPPKGLGDEDDRAHEGFEALHTLVERLRPALLLHGHIHPYGVPKPDRHLGDTRVVNVVPFKVIDLRP